MSSNACSVSKPERTAGICWSGCSGAGLSAPMVVCLVAPGVSSAVAMSVSCCGFFEVGRVRAALHELPVTDHSRDEGIDVRAVASLPELRVRQRGDLAEHLVP